MRQRKSKIFVDLKTKFSNKQAIKCPDCKNKAIKYRKRKKSAKVFYSNPIEIKDT